MRYFIRFFVLIFQNLACILYLEFILIWASCISGVPKPPGLLATTLDSIDVGKGTLLNSLFTFD